MHKTRNHPAELDAAAADLRIRPGRADEADLLTDLSLGAKPVWGYDAGFLARCRAVMTVKAAAIAARPHFVAQLDGRIAGFYGFEPEAEGIGLDYLFVAPDLIGRGLGRALWNHLDGQGEIPPERYPNAAAFVAALHARLPGIHVQAWMGQMEKRRGGPLDVADPATRTGIVRTAQLFLDLGFDGIHYDIEPLQRDDAALHALLDATRALTQARGRLLSLATTEIEPFAGANTLVNTLLPDAVLWSPDDYREAAARVDQLAVMSYNTALPWDWLYGSFISFETRRIAGAVAGKAAIMMGVPTYEEPGWTFHPGAENMESALRGIRLALADASPSSARPGVAIYARWTTDDAEWATYRRLWRGEP